MPGVNAVRPESALGGVPVVAWWACGATLHAYSNDVLIDPSHGEVVQVYYNSGKYLYRGCSKVGGGMKCWTTCTLRMIHILSH